MASVLSTALSRRVFHTLTLSLLCLLLCGAAPARAQTAQPAPLQPPGFAAQLADFWAANAQMPARDRYDLYQRLGNPDDAAGSAIAHQTTKPPLHLGDGADFSVLDIRTGISHTIHATVQVVTAHLYMLTDTAYAAAINTAALQDAANTFEAKIYPTDRADFGDEWSPGVDGDPHLIVLNTPLSASIAGYFSSDDEIVRPVSPTSNEREIFYMGLPLNGSPARQQQYESTLAHEFQHMIEWRQNGHQDTWLNEGSSVLAELLTGYAPYSQAAAFLGAPNTQLTAWACASGCNVSAHYGAGFLFTNYLNQRFGQPTVRDIIALPDANGSPQSGGAGVDRALLATQRTFDVSFDSVFADWTVANALLSDPGATTNPRYAVPNLAGHTLALTADNQQFPLRLHDSVAQYAARYYPLTLPNSDRIASLTFRGDSLAPLTAAPDKGRVWWSGRGDNGDSSLTRSFDLCQPKAGQCSLKPGAKVTLQFSAWYDTEPRYDYGFVEVSTDGGTRWQTLPTKYTRATKDDPSPANYGNGLTGQSDPAGAHLSDSDTTPVAWVRDEADVSAYAGQTILLRFEYVTDDSYNRSGWLISDIAIPQIGYTDNPEAETAATAGDFGADFPKVQGISDSSSYGATPQTGGWVAHGFLRTTTAARQRWYVQIIALDDAGHATVTPVPLDATGNGSLAIDKSLGTHITVVVAAAAPLSLVPATFDVAVSEKSPG